MKQKRRYPEDEAQRALMQWLQIQHPAAYAWTIHVPNGGRRGAAEAGIFKALGVKPGVPDVLCFAPIGGFVGLAVEMKRPGATRSSISDEQRYWIERLRKAGWRAEAAPGFPHALEIFAQYIAGDFPASWQPWGE
jgi:hypothetical protein